MEKNPLKLTNIRRRGIYLLPNLLTTAALFAGFYSIVAAIDGNFVQACVAHFVAMAFDGADGRLARLPKRKVISVRSTTAYRIWSRLVLHRP